MNINDKYSGPYVIKRKGRKNTPVQPYLMSNVEFFLRDGLT